jgi:hypothetical protein
MRARKLQSVSKPALPQLYTIDDGELILAVSGAAPRARGDDRHVAVDPNKHPAFPRDFAVPRHF